MFDRVSADVRTALAVAGDEARVLGASAIEPEHLLLALLQASSLVADILSACGLDLDALRRFLATEATSTSSPPFSSQARRTLGRALREALDSESTYIGAEHLLLACLADEHGAVEAILDAFGTSTASVRLMVDLSCPRQSGHGDQFASVANMLTQAFGPLAVGRDAGC